MVKILIWLVFFIVLLVFATYMRGRRSARWWRRSFGFEVPQ